jgi:hypothetical protein
MADAIPPVEPVLHPVEDVEAALERGDVHCDAVRQTLAYFGTNEEWSFFYSISDIAGMEVSLLIDGAGQCFVDWGTVSRVGLNPPEGGVIPFRVWVHTHPSGNSYWSATDRNTLAVASAARIMQSAIVLGHGEMKCAHWTAEPAEQPLAPEGPLSNWTDESVIDYEEKQPPWFEEVVQ